MTTTKSKMGKWFFAALLLFAFSAEVLCDTNANCTYEEIKGTWIFELGEGGQDRTINCSKPCKIFLFCVSSCSSHVATGVNCMHLVICGWSFVQNRTLATYFFHKNVFQVFGRIGRSPPPLPFDQSCMPCLGYNWIFVLFALTLKSCAFSVAVKPVRKVEITLHFINTATDDFGNKGQWTIIYNQVNRVCFLCGR